MLLPRSLSENRDSPFLPSRPLWQQRQVFPAVPPALRRNSDMTGISISRDMKTKLQPMSPKPVPPPAPVVDLTSSSPTAPETELLSASTMTLDHPSQDIKATRKRSGDSLLEVNLRPCNCAPISPHAPRPMNSFMLYRKHHSELLVARKQGIANPDISKMLSRQWKAEPENEKNRWRAFAEMEKTAHAAKYPDYRYQPSTTKRRKANPDHDDTISDRNWSLAGTTLCTRCGGRASKTPKPSAPATAVTTTSSPNTADGIPSLFGSSQRKSSIQLPMPKPSIASTPSTRYLPMFNDLSLSPSRTFSFRPSDNIPYPSVPPNGDGLPDVAMSPGHKNSPAPILQVSRGSAGLVPQQKQAVAMTPLSAQYPSHQEAGVPLQPIATGPQPARRNVGIKLPPIQTIGLDYLSQQRRFSNVPPKTAMTVTPSARAQAVPFPDWHKLGILNSVARPMRTKPGDLRGVVIAVEGDHAEAARSIADWLGKHLARTIDIGVNGHKAVQNIHLMDGPTISEKVLNQERLFEVVKNWHAKNRHVHQILTSPPTERGATQKDGHKKQEPATGDRAKGAASTPKADQLPSAVIFRNYLLSATDAAARQLKLADLYGANAHWSWTACLWRGIIGPDLVIYISDTDARDVNSIDVLEYPKTFIVTRSRAPWASVEGSVCGVQPGALRRLGFEVLEWLERRKDMMRAIPER